VGPDAFVAKCPGASAGDDTHLLTSDRPPMDTEIPRSISFGAALRVWATIGLLSFGGPAGQIALMHKELVQKRRWLDEARFLHALNYCMLLPGPEAQQLATYIGWLMHRMRGGLAAGLLFVLPGFAAILGLSLVYVGYGNVPAVAAVFFGLKAAVLAIVIEAVLRIGKRALKKRWFVWISCLAFVAIFFFDLPFPAVVGLAGAFGFIGSKYFPARFPDPTSVAQANSQHTVIGHMAADGQLTHTLPSWSRTLTLMAIFGILWGGPIAILFFVFGAESVFVKEAIFFSKTAVVTFGGAYAVLSYIAQQAVETFHWIAPGEMIDGLGLAETTPGPLIMVVQFVGFLGAFRNPGELAPVWGGILGALVTVWVTFVPCFLWIFVGAPYIEALRGHRGLHAALSTITAAIVGVIANLSLWFALNVLFSELRLLRAGPLRVLLPVAASLNLPAAALVLVAGLMVLRLKASMPTTLATSAFLGVLWQLLRT